MKPYIGTGENAFTTVDGKTFPFTTDPQSRQAARAKAEAHDSNRTRAIEAKLERPLTEAEYFAGRASHFEDRDSLQQERDSKFTPVRAPESKYAKHKAELLRKIQERDVAKMDTLERQLFDLERLEQQDAEKLADEQAQESHLANPRTKAALKELNGLLDSYRWDDSIAASEVAAVENAIKQWSDHLGDTEVAESMLRSVLDNHDARIQASDDAKRKQIRQIEATLVGDRKPSKVEIARTGDLLDDGHALYVAMDDSNFPFRDTQRVREANEVYRESGDSAAIEKLLDAYAVGPDQTLA